MNQRKGFILKAQYGKKIYSINISIEGDRLVIDFPFSYDIINDVKMMEGANFDPETKLWSCLATRRNLFALDCMSTDKRFLKHFYKSLNSKINPFRTNLWDHQVDIFREIVSKNFKLIAAEMRCGKTLPTLEAIEWYARDVFKRTGEPIYKEEIWWVAPKSALQGLERELDRVKFSRHLTLLTYDKFRNIVKSGMFCKPPRILVMDECHKLKTTKSQTSEAAKIIADLQFEHYDLDCYRVALSGTPAPRDPSDWWNQCEIVMPGFIKEPSKEKLKLTLSESELNETTAGHSFWEFKSWKEDEVERLYRRLKGLVSVYLKSECLNLPPIQYETIELKPNKKVLAVANTLASVSPNALTAINLMRQISDGFRYTKEYDEDMNRTTRGETEYFGSPKEDQLRMDLDLYEDAVDDCGRVIIYAGFTKSVDKCVEICVEKEWTVLRLDARGYKVFGEGDKDLCLDEMDGSTNKGVIKKLAFVAQADAAATGLELSASPVIIRYSNSNNGAAFQQAEARPHSNNMNRQLGLLVKDYIHLPIDLTILEAHKSKRKLQSISMGEVKATLQKAMESEEVEH